jgi:D-alanyl-D-alanine carboxypeptidase (penicillin-binding protein 5/6)
VRSVRGLVVAVTLLVACLAGAGEAAAAPAVQARAYVVETASGAVLAQRLPTERRAVASITKLMTVLVALERARLDEVVTVPRAATGVGESTAFLRPGERVTVRDLAIGALVPSGNDAATALAWHAGGGSIPRFVALMNAKAAALGLGDTRFANPHGLDQPGHHSSARDTAELLRAAVRVPFIRRSAGAERATLSNGRTVESTDGLLGRLPELVAGKTGHTSAAGWSQVGLARRGRVQIVASVLGAPTEEQRDRDLEALLRWGLDQFATVKAVDAARGYARVQVGWGLEPLVVRPARNVRLVVRTGRPLLERVTVTRTASLPVRKGERLGRVDVYDGGRRVARVPLVASRSVGEPGLVAKAWWTAGRTARKLGGMLTP